MNGVRHREMTDRKFSNFDRSDSTSDVRSRRVSFYYKRCDYSPHRATPDRTGPHRTAPGPYRAGNDWLFHFHDELKGVKRANYPQLTKEMNPNRRSSWVGDGRIQCFLLIQLKPEHRGFTVMGGSKDRNSRNPPKFTKSSVLNRSIVAETCLNQQRQPPTLSGQRT